MKGDEDVERGSGGVLLEEDGRRRETREIFEKEGELGVGVKTSEPPSTPSGSGRPLQSGSYDLTWRPRKIPGLS